MAAPPSFVPSADEISTLASEIQETAQAYKASTEASPKLLQTLSSKSRTLNNLTTDPASRFLAVYYQGHQLATLNAASLMGLFSAIPPEPGSSASVSEIAQRTGAELSLTRRVTRALVAIEILTEAPATPSEEDRYAHTPLSQMFIMRGPNAMVQQMVCQMLRALTFLGDFFNANGLRAPFDGRNSLWACMVGKKNMDFWDVMATKDPKELQLVNETMSGIAQLVLPDVINAYDFGTLATGLDGRQAALVDCGGGRGHDLVAILERWPELKGKAVLQDLPQVVGDSTVAKPPDVDVQSWNFFKSEQPLKGAKAYMFKSVLHDWPDQACREILRNVKPALIGHDSRLLLAETVIPDKNPPWLKCMQDMNMLTLAGKERSVSEWTELLNGSGFRIIDIHGLDQSTYSIIEAVVDG